MQTISVMQNKDTLLDHLLAIFASSAHPITDSAMAVSLLLTFKLPASTLKPWSTTQAWVAI